jgi:membrane protein YqaA with SNARE-associated domain
MKEFPANETDQPSQLREEQGQDQKFGWKHTLAILFSVSITALIVVFQDKLIGLEKFAYVGAFAAMLVGNSTVILPVPGLIVVYVLGSVLNPLFVGLFAGPGAALGELTGYVAGYGSSAIVDNLKLYHLVSKWMRRYGPIIITLMAAVPNPVFDMAGLVAGSLRMKWWHFLIAAWIGKTIQGILVAYAGALSLGWVEQFLTR